MPKVDHLSKLLEAVAAENWAVARAAASRIADEEEKKGHHSAAERLRGALHPNGRRVRTVDGTTAGQWMPASQFLVSALTRLHGDTTVGQVDLRPALRSEIHDVIREWRHRDALTARGIEPRRKLLLHGPPGCGKSLTALALGNEIGVPAYVVRIDAVVGAYLGQTALRIRELFHFAEGTECVLLLDEIDALGKRRGSQLDVGELDRVVISLMQELEHARPRGLVIATSNLAGQLDEALFRRFDAVLEFPRPTRAEIARFARNRVRATGLLTSARAVKITQGATSFAEAVRRIASDERAAILRSIEG